jgi:hypothetical protein
LADFINQQFVPATINIKEKPADFHRFDVLWTPTILILDENGKERFRIEGYLPRDEFAAHLVMGLARVAFMSKRWADAEQLYNEVVQKYGHTGVAPAAVYWLGVSRYKKTNDHHELGKVVSTLKEKYPDSPWNKRAVPWAA